jgi:hypothetical protein
MRATSGSKSEFGPSREGNSFFKYHVSVLDPIEGTKGFKRVPGLGGPSGSKCQE